MFVRKKKNKSGSTSVVVIDKSNGKFKELKTIGISRDEKEISELYRSGKKWIRDNYGEPDIFAIYDREQEEKQTAERLLSNVENILLNGTKLILDRVFGLIGFDAIRDDVFKSLVVARICQPLLLPPPPDGDEPLGEDVPPFDSVPSSPPEQEKLHTPNMFTSGSSGVGWGGGANFWLVTKTFSELAPQALALNVVLPIMVIFKGNIENCFWDFCFLAWHATFVV